MARAITSCGSWPPPQPQPRIFLKVSAIEANEDEAAAQLARGSSAGELAERHMLANTLFWQMQSTAVLEEKGTQLSERRAMRSSGWRRRRRRCHLRPWSGTVQVKVEQKADMKGRSAMSRGKRQAVVA